MTRIEEPTRGRLGNVGSRLGKAPKRSFVADIAAGPATDLAEEQPRATAAPVVEQPAPQSPQPAAPTQPVHEAPAPAQQVPLQGPAAGTAPTAAALPVVQEPQSPVQENAVAEAQQQPASQPPVAQPAPGPAAPTEQPEPAKPRVADTKMKQTIRMDQADNKRAKRAFNATRHLHGQRNWEDFVARALMKEVELLEQQYNGGEEFQATEELPKGRPLNM